MAPVAVLSVAAPGRLRYRESAWAGGVLADLHGTLGMLVLTHRHPRHSLPHPLTLRSYGWLLPAGAAGQGRGSRSLVHVAQASALMHDASYLCPLLLRWAGGRSRAGAAGPRHCRRAALRLPGWPAQLASVLTRCSAYPQGRAGRRAHGAGGAAGPGSGGRVGR